MLTKWSRWPSPGAGQADSMHLLIQCTENSAPHLHYSCWKYTAWLLTTVNHQGSPDWGTVYKITGLNALKVSRSRNRGGPRSYSRIGKAEKTWKLNVMQNPRLDSGQRMKRYCWDSWQNLKMDCRLDNNVIEMLNFLLLKIELWLCKRTPFFLQYTLRYLVV